MALLSSWLELVSGLACLMVDALMTDARAVANKRARYLARITPLFRELTSDQRCCFKDQFNILFG